MPRLPCCCTLNDVLYFAGAEQATHRATLSDCGVTRYAFNATALARAIKRLDKWDVAAHLPDEAEWVVYADQGTTWPMVEPLLEQNPELLIGPSSWLSKPLEGINFAPYWNDGLATDSEYVALLDTAVKNQTTLRKVLSQHANRTTVAVTGSSRGIDRIDVVVSNAWLAVQKHGETQVWANNKLHRYPGKDKELAGARHVRDAERMGLDPEKVLAGESSELSRLAVLSWQQWEERRSRRGNLVALPSNLATSKAAHPASGQRTLANATVVPRHDVMLPVMAMEPIISRYKDGEGRDVIEETTALTTPAESARVCNTCFLAHNCPAFNPDHSCAYRIPVEIRTKDQLQAAMRAMVEMQGQRVMFARFAEELDGQGTDVNVSMELDRFFRILGAMRSITDTRDVLRLEMEARAGAGVLSRLFGSDVGNNARNVSTRMEGDDVINVLDPPD